MEAKRLELLKQIAAGIAAQFGDRCEVVVHDVSSNHPEHTIVHIENGYISGRKVGDGASSVVLEQLQHQNEQPQDHLCYLTRTPDGKILKSSSLYIRNSRGAVTAIFSINYDITNIMMMHQELGEFMLTRDREQSEPEKIINVNNVLSELIEQSVSLVGKPVALMSKDETKFHTHLFNPVCNSLDSLRKTLSVCHPVTKSGDKVAKYFGISKYTL